jgi:hypothetical protein
VSDHELARPVLSTHPYAKCCKVKFTEIGCEPFQNISEDSFFVKNEPLKSRIGSPVANTANSWLRIFYYVNTSGGENAQNSHKKLLRNKGEFTIKFHISNLNEVDTS